MTLPEFGDLLKTADPSASHYYSEQQPNYTVWAEHNPNDMHGDDHVSERAWKVQIDRFTKIEFDPIAQAINEMLDANDIAYTIVGPVYETDTGYIHHIWSCEVD